MAISAVLPSTLAFGHRGVDSQTVFVTKQETAQDLLAGAWTTQANLFATQANALETNVNAKEATVVAKEALVNPHYTAIDTVSANVTNINSVATTIVPNIAEILLADTNAATATTKAGEALASADASALSATNAYNSELAAAALLDSFDDRYLGSKAVEPTLDNDGNPLASGALYFNTTTNTMRVYDSVTPAWISLSFVPTSHSSLTGLANDDHTQYHNDARGDARYLKLIGGSLTGALNTAKATVASSATTSDIWTGGNLIDFTGTATVTSFPTAPQAGAIRELVCAGACSFTAGANMLIDGVASGQSVTCTIGDTVIVRAITTTQFKFTRLNSGGLQEKLISGTNIKTVNSISVLGVGNLSISAPLGSPYIKTTFNANSRFIPNFTGRNAATTITTTNASTIHYVPFAIGRDMTISALALRVASGSAGTVTVAIYSADINTQLPKDRLAMTAGMSTSTTASIEGNITNTNLIANNIYYFGIYLNTVGASFTVAGRESLLGADLTVNPAYSFDSLTESGTSLPLVATSSGIRTLSYADSFAIYLKEV